jgi:hypothetical protein
MPTGNIQGITMPISVWCKIDSDKYRLAANEMPALIVTFDDGASSEIAYALPGNTWQILSVNITPTTSF